MNSARVIHLVSNSTTFPNNKPNDFKVGYNVPFNMSGKKVALVSATLTKARPNVVDQSLSVKVPARLQTGSMITRYVVLNSLVPHEDMRPKFTPTTLCKLFKYPPVRDMQEAPNILSFTIEPVLLSDQKHLSLIVSNHTFTEMSVTFLVDVLKYNGWRLVYTDILPEGGVRQSATVTAGIADKVGAVGVIIEKSDLLMRNFSSSEKLSRWSFKIPPAIKIVFTFDVSNILTANLDTPEKLSPVLDGMRFIVKYRETKLLGAPINEEIPVESGEYKNIQEVIETINRKAVMKKYGQFKLQQGIVEFKKMGSQRPPYEIILGGLKSHLGFNNSSLEIGDAPETHVQRAENPPDMTHGTHNFFIYCSLVKDVAVNERMLQLLGTVDAVKGSYGEQVRHPVQVPLYVDCVGGDQQVVEVTIADDRGNSNGLLMGTSQLTLNVSD